MVYALIRPARPESVSVTMYLRNERARSGTLKSGLARIRPSAARSIEKLLMRSESFRELCEDLAEAERALAAVDRMPGALQFPSRTECQGWVESLMNEIESALRESKVVALPTETLARRGR